MIIVSGDDHVYFRPRTDGARGEQTDTHRLSGVKLRRSSASARNTCVFRPACYTAISSRN